MFIIINCTLLPNAAVVTIDKAEVKNWIRVNELSTLAKIAIHSILTMYLHVMNMFFIKYHLNGITPCCFKKSGSKMQKTTVYCFALILSY